MLQKMAEKFQRIKHKYDILEDNMAILLRDYRKVSAGVDSIQATFITLSKSRSAYDEAKINLPKFVHARSLLKNARLDGERIEDGFEKNSLPNDMLTGSESFVDPNTQKDAIQTADTIEKKILKAFELVPTLPPRVIRTDTMDPNGAAAFSRRRNAIVIQNAVHRLDDTMDNIDTWIAFLEPKIVSYRAQEVTQERVVCDAAKEVWRGVVGRMQGRRWERLGIGLRSWG
ncbi:hypothetical protein BC829DRAFT_399068 [Chytridium lagenaria]|nr:hypothetical protein BC829DRAFT_399068 [Chytridium lagenaria]